MTISKALQWLIQNEAYKDIVMKLAQPVTAKQISTRMQIKLDAARFWLQGLAQRDYLYCLNETARRSRLFWLTSRGLSCQEKLRGLHDLAPLKHQFPLVDWNLYGWTCFSQRSAIMKAAQEKTRPAQIRRRARSQDLNVRMTTVHICRGIKGLVKKGMLRKIEGKKGRPMYVLTKLGREVQSLHCKADTAL